MYRIAKNFYHLAKVSEARIVGNTQTNLYIKTIPHWYDNKFVIDTTFETIHKSAEKGGMYVYLSKDHPFLTTPEIHSFFNLSGFTVDRNLIEWKNIPEQ